MVKWKKGQLSQPVSVDGRFRIEGHWNEKPGYYELIDTKTGRCEKSPKMKDIKALAEEIVANESK